MTKQKLTTRIVLTIEHRKPIADLADLVAGRAYTLDGVTNATAAIKECVIASPTARSVNHG